MRPRVVITAADLFASNADSFSAFIPALMSGKSVVSPVTRFAVKSLSCQQALQLPGLDSSDAMIETKLARQLIQRNLSILPDPLTPVDIVVASTMGAGYYGQQLITNLNQSPEIRLSHEQTLQCFSSSLAENIKECFGLQGRTLTVCDACASGNSALGIAAHYIRAGRSTAVMVLGTNTLLEMAFYGFSALRLLSPDGVAPFDKHRRGLLLGEGVGLLMLEDLESAKSRGALILAELLGFGASADAFHITSPDSSGQGPAAAMQHALRDARISTQDIDYINAHGTGTRQNDRVESLAIHQVFSSPPPVSSTKSMIGHCLGGSGVLEAIACVSAIQEQFLPPTINVTEPDPECALDVVPGQARPARLTTVMSNSFGFGGNNAVIILQKFEGT